MSENAIEVSKITKTFPGVIANRDIAMTVRRGTVHAIVGENGAGKSTLMKILYGMQRPDSGSILVDGVEQSYSSPVDAITAGVGMVHQHFMLSDNFTVLENIILGDEPTRGLGRLDLPAARKRIQAVCDAYGISLPLSALAEDLSVGERQRVEIVKVLYRGARILILDEPTAVLVPQEVQDLFAHLRSLVAKGLTVLFVSHKLDEVLSIADAITVIRAGTTVATLTPDETDAGALAQLMVGADLPAAASSGTPRRDEIALQLREIDLPGVGARDALDGVSMRIHAGEIVGLAGVEGNGQVELIDTIMGLLQPSHGTIELAGADVTHRSTRERRSAGLACIPYDRHREGLLLDAPLWENRLLGNQHMAPLSSRGWLRIRATKQDTMRIVDDFDVRTPGVLVNAGALSGGNQQKLIVGRELATAPRLLIAANPTRGVDVGAQVVIWSSLRRAREEGAGILLISSDLDELIGLADRLLVIHGGRISNELDPRDVTPETLGLAMAGLTTEETP